LLKEKKSPDIVRRREKKGGLGLVNMPRAKRGVASSESAFNLGQKNHPIKQIGDIKMRHSIATSQWENVGKARQITRHSQKGRHQRR